MPPWLPFVPLPPCLIVIESVGFGGDCSEIGSGYIELSSPLNLGVTIVSVPGGYQVACTHPRALFRGVPLYFREL